MRSRITMSIGFFLAFAFAGLGLSGAPGEHALPVQRQAETKADDKKNSSIPIDPADAAFWLDVRNG